MLAYLVRRLLYAIPIVLGVLLILFVIFNAVSNPEAIARRAIGEKASGPAVQAWLKKRGYDRPAYFDPSQKGMRRFTEARLCNYLWETVRFQFGKSSRDDTPIGDKILRGMGPSLALAVPEFVFGLLFGLFFALLVAFFRGTYIDGLGVLVSVVLMSVTILVYIIGGQYVLSKVLRWFPISGFDRGAPWRFILLPLAIGLVGGLGSSVRFYRTVFLEEANRDYVRTARSKGVTESAVMLGHVLRNALLPILTGAVMGLLFLFTGSLLMERFFGIPGLGKITVDAIENGDFPMIKANVYIGTLLFIAGNILTDISYTLADPRVRLGAGAEVSSGGARRGSAIRVVLNVFVLGALTLVAARLLFLLWASEGSSRALPLAWEAHDVQNGVVLALGALFFGGLVAAARNPFARGVAGAFFRRPIGVLALGAFSLFALVAVLDSVSWRDRAPGETEASLAAREPRTLLDRLFAAAGVPALPGGAGEPPEHAFREESYSAPLAAKLFYDDKPLKFGRRHLLGTDILGDDVLYRTLKGVRIAMTVGTLTLLITIPIAVVAGLLAGYFGGIVDDFVQYSYTVLGSIPDLLLLVSLLLVLGRGIVQVCVALGVTSWVGLCRLVRAETLKVRELEYVQAARTLGVRPGRILVRHVLPNIFHLVLISAVLGFSGLVLAESVLSYLKIGVNHSWGGMIAYARDELARDPIIWWNLAGPSAALFTLVLAANVLGDTLRDVLDPRTRKEK